MGENVMTHEYEIKKGEIINLSSGCYSDFTYNATVVFIRNCNLAKAFSDLKKEYLTDKDKWPFHVSVSKDQIVTWLVANQYCMPVTCRDVHLGDYSEITIMKDGEYHEESVNDWEDERDEMKAGV
jgi:hypothetical protein